MAIDYTSDIGKIRLVIGDIDEDNLHFSDEQLQGYLDMTGNVIFACIFSARAWANELASTAGDMYRIDTIEYQEGKTKSNQLLAIVKSLEDSVANGTNPLLIGVPFTTGLYVTDIEENIERILDREIVGPQINDGQYRMVDVDGQDGPYY